MFLYPELTKQEVELLKTLVYSDVSACDLIGETRKYNFLSKEIKKRLELLSNILFKLNLELEHYEKNK